MRPLWWMAGSSMVSWLAIAAIPGLDSDRDVLFGMLAPLAGAAATWVLVARTYTSEPGLLTGRMVAAFAAKVLFFGVYVTLMLKAVSVQALPFVISFTSYFIGLHLFEALCLQRLFARGAAASDRR